MDAVIAGHFSEPAQRTQAIEQLATGGITWIRERSSWPAEDGSGQDARPVWREARAAGLKVLAFTRQVNARVERPAGRNRLGQNLLEVYEKARYLAETHQGTVDAWELLNEPDFLFVADTPDAAAAFQKALYLGLKASDPGTPVLRPAIGGSPAGAPVGGSSFLVPRSSLKYRHPAEQTAGNEEPRTTNQERRSAPGYWTVALRNGLWDYGDAGNIHFYGWTETLDELVQAHRLMDAWAYEAGLTQVDNAPIWITEINADRGKLGPAGEEAARVWAEQSEILPRLWELAAAEDVAVFMPFVLKWPNRPELSFWDADLEPLPSWHVYLDAVGAEKEAEAKGESAASGKTDRLFIESPLSDRQPSPVVLQWVADEATGVPNKFSSAYRFQREEGMAEGPAFASMGGELRIYNFSEEPVSGAVRWTTDGEVGVALGAFAPWSARAPEVVAESVEAEGPEPAPTPATDRAERTTRPLPPLPAVEQPAFLPLWIEEGKGSDPDLVPFEQLAEAGKATRAVGEANGGTASDAVPSKGERGTTEAVTIPPMSAVTVPLRFEVSPRVPATWFRTAFSAEWLPEAPSRAEASPSEARSLLYFHLEPTPAYDLFQTMKLRVSDGPPVALRARPDTPLVPANQVKTDPRSGTLLEERRNDDNLAVQPAAHSDQPSVVFLAPVPLTAAGTPDLYHRDYPFGYEWTSQVGVWTGINGLTIESLENHGDTFQVLRVRVDPVGHAKKHPRVVARLPNGLPWEAVIALRASEPFTDALFNINVFLIDRWGQAWRVDEVIHIQPHLRSQDKFLSMEHFVHSYFSNLVPGKAFDPADVVEIQLALPRTPTTKPVTFALGILQKKAEN